MFSTTLTWLAIVCYCIGIGLVFRQLQSRPMAAGQFSRWVRGIGATAVLLHSLVLYWSLMTPTGMDVGFFSIMSLVAWLAALLLLVVTFQEPIECLSIIVYPFAVISLLLRSHFHQQNIISYNITPGLDFHILISLLAYSLLSIAAVQSILLYIQDAHLHNKQPGGFIRSLPPLQSMEKLLFRLIILGFIVLSISLASGFLYLEDMFAQHIAHKTILSIIAWLVFLTLLIGRWRFGWRGRVAIRWVLTGFVLLMLAYFGSKFVVELLLQR